MLKARTFVGSSRVPDGLTVLQNLYVGRAHIVWKQPELLPWLERNAHEVIRQVEAKEDFVAECAKRRATRYQGAPRNIYRHVLMSDIQDAKTALPRVRSLVSTLI